MLYLLNAVRSVIGWCSSSPRRAARTPFQARKSRRQPGNSHAGQSDQGEFDLHYYQFNIGDYARDTSHLSLVEHGIYRLLLDWCYLNEKPITTEKALRVGRGFPSETQSVLSEFFLGSDEGWEHPRVNAEIDQFHKKAEINRQNGAKGGRPKTQNNPVGSQSQPIRNPNQEPITNNQYKEPSSPGKPDDGFAEFWKAYPRKVGKGAALKSWGKIKSKADTLQAILKAIAWQRTAKDWTKDGGQFIPHPSTWLNEQRWLDEAPASAEPAIPFDREAYEAKRKAEADAAKARMRQEQAEWEAQA